ncbi:MAG: 3-hydroxyacyl-[acyl-carrier-protein] dehydratase FabZ [Waddliaceae bacterium]|nr:3-hydroxyacyl-[acyl-carrier-protein] dehydratase FabZ [Waddliaceae bacterium]
MDARKIASILPHRYPFLLVDRIVKIDRENNEIVGQKNVSMNESFFQGHFPDAPIMPGVLILEALAQVGAVLIGENGFGDRIALFMSANNVKFRQPVRPGDILMLHASDLHCSSRGGRVRAKATVGGKLAVEAEIGFAFFDKEKI